MLGLFEGLAQSSDVQALSGFLADRASLRRAEGRLEDALADGTAAVDVARTLGIAAQASKQGLVEALEAALRTRTHWTQSRSCSLGSTPSPPDRAHRTSMRRHDGSGRGSTEMPEAISRRLRAFAPWACRSGWRSLSSSTPN